MTRLEWFPAPAWMRRPFELWEQVENEMEKLLPNQTVRLSVQSAVGVALFAFGMVSGLYVARLDIGKTVAEQGRQIEVNTAHLGAIDQNLTKLNEWSHPPDQQVSQQEHAELLRRLDDNQTMVLRSIDQLNHSLSAHEAETSAALQAMDRRIDSLEQLVTERLGVPVRERGKP